MIEALRHIDHQLFHFVNQTMVNILFDYACPVLRNAKVMVGCYIVFAFWLYRLYPEQFLKIAAAGALTFFLTDQLSAHLIKGIVHRLRPCNNPEIGARLLLVTCGNGYSFVSAHAANSFGLAGFVAAVSQRKSLSAVLFTWASLVSFSQVYVGVHFPADVIGGAALGIAAGGTVGMLLKNNVDLQQTIIH